MTQRIWFKESRHKHCLCV